jgi:hypothetical protein
VTDSSMVLAPADRQKRRARRAASAGLSPAYFTFMLRLYPLLPAERVLVSAVVA